MQYQIPKGLYDILPYGADEKWQLSNRWQYIESIIRPLAKTYNFHEVRTPIFERTELFCRGVGETSDIVSKEMYTFLDKADRSMSLRPEGTASLVRAFLEHNLNNLTSVHKFFYIGPMFRYDRPQAGRYRQHHQFGTEVIGNPNPEQDVEIIDLLMTFYQRVGLKNLTLNINSVGDIETRNAYRKALHDYLQPHFDSLSKDSQERFAKNPLRILDSKAEQDLPIVAKAPSLLEYLSSAAKEHFEKTLSLLQDLKIPYQVNDKLVRGLDYYTHTVFEIVKTGSFALGGGGRYDNLLESFGGPALPGVGFGTGLERVLQAMEIENCFFPKASAPFLYFVPLCEEARKTLFPIVSSLRHAGVPCEIELHTYKIQKALQNAVRQESLFAVLFGEEELKNGNLKRKNLLTRTEETISLAFFEEEMKKEWQAHEKL